MSPRKHLAISIDILVVKTGVEGVLLAPSVSRGQRCYCIYYNAQDSLPQQNNYPAQISIVLHITNSVPEVT